MLSAQGVAVQSSHLNEIPVNRRDALSTALAAKSTPVTDADVDEFLAGLGQRGQGYNTPEGRAMILDEIIGSRLLLLDAKRNLFEADPAFQAQLRKLKENLLVSFAAEKVVGSVTVSDKLPEGLSFVSGENVVCEDGTGKLKLSTEKMQACPYVISNTFGFAIGDQENGAPIALSGRVLVYTDKPTDTYKVGDVLCAGENGTAHKMSRK